MPNNRVRVDGDFFERQVLLGIQRTWLTAGDGKWRLRGKPETLNHGQSQRVALEDRGLGLLIYQKAICVCTQLLETICLQARAPLSRRCSCSTQLLRWPHIPAWSSQSLNMPAITHSTMEPMIHFSRLVTSRTRTVQSMERDELSLRQVPARIRLVFRLFRWELRSYSLVVLVSRAISLVAIFYDSTREVYGIALPLSPLPPMLYGSRKKEKYGTAHRCYMMSGVTPVANRIAVCVPLSLESRFAS